MWWLFYFTSIPVSRIGFILTGILSDYLRQNKRSKVPAPGQCQGAAWRQVGLAETPNLSKRYHAKYVRPYLLRNLNIDHIDHVWGVDITYLPLKKGFMYLFAIIDWYSRQIVDYEISYSLEKAFVMRCLKRALSRRKPEIINSDQGSHFTNQSYLDLMEENQVRVSMDGKGQALDNIITERFFRSLKYDDIYINEYSTPREMIAGVKEYMHIYNTIRPHSSLDGLTPNEFCQRAKQIAA